MVHACKRQQFRRLEQDHLNPKVQGQPENIPRLCIKIIIITINKNNNIKNKNN